MTDGSRTPSNRLPTLKNARDRIGDVLRIARWEVARGVDTVDRRAFALGLVALLLAAGVFGSLAVTGVDGVALDHDIYRVGVSPDSPYYAPVTESPSLEAVSPRANHLDVRVENGRFWHAGTRKGQAASTALRSAVQSYNDEQMTAEPNQSAAFPVFVDLRYVKQGLGIGGAGANSVGSGTGSNGATDHGTSGQGTASVGSDGTGAGSADTGSGGRDNAQSAGSQNGALPVPGVGNGLFASSASGSPADIRPPFPFGALVLAFAFLVPMNFVVQTYGSTILNERVNRRGELLLVAPVSANDVVIGKTLPYALAMVGVTVVIALAIGGGVVSVAAVVPIGLLFLAATFVAGMFARSFKELTFLTVTISVFLTSYSFVPAIFTNVTPIALISPLTLVVRELQGDPISVVQYGFSTGPFYLTAAVLFLLGVGVYREEDMFTQRPVPLKFLDALDSRIRGPSSMAVLSALFVPFVFVAELLALAVLFVLPLSASIPVLLVVIALVEELAKSVHVYAGFAKSRFRRTPRTALKFGALSGFGFFLGEKLFAVVQLVGLQTIPLGRATFLPSGISSGAAGVDASLGVALLLAPLVLHTVTTSVASLGASRGRRWYVGALAVAVLLHAGYDLTVVTALG